MSDISGDDLAASILADAGAAAEPVKKKGKLLPTIAAVGVLTLVAIGGGAGFGMLVGARPVPEAEAPAPAEGTDVAIEAAKDEADDTPADVIVKLEPLVTNISSPPKTLMRIEASIIIRPGEVDNAEVLAAQIQNDTLTFLRTVDLAQVEGARGLLHLREDLRERAKLRSPAVVDYLIQSLVAQ